MKLDLGFSDRDVAVLKQLWYRVQAVRKIEINERTFLVFQLVDDRRFFELPLDVGELAVIPDLPDAERPGLALVPAIVKVQIARIRALLFFLRVQSRLLL